MYNYQQPLTPSRSLLYLRNYTKHIHDRAGPDAVPLAIVIYIQP